MSEAHGAPSPSGSRRPGGTDVARLAGVSQKTVSRVFNNEPYVGDQVRRRVLEAARQLGYRPNLAARALQSGRTHRIGVASLGSALFGPATLLVALERAARQTGYALSIVNTFEDEQGSLADALLNLLAQDVDAIVLLEPIDEGETSLTVDVPVLMLGRAPLVSAPKVLTVDAGEAGDPAEDVVRHMLALGHATVHHVAGPLRWWAARERLDGWQRVLKEEGRTVPSYVEGNWTAASGYRAGQELARDPEVTAVFVGQRRHGDRSPARASGIGAARAAGREPGGLRRHPAGRLPVTGADDGTAGQHHARHGRTAAARGVSPESGGLTGPAARADASVDAERVHRSAAGSPAEGRCHDLSQPSFSLISWLRSP
jgi:DNA-binding LacI/PurR family transcriptional regulator